GLRSLARSPLAGRAAPGLLRSHGAPGRSPGPGPRKAALPGPGALAEAAAGARVTDLTMEPRQQACRPEGIPEEIWRQAGGEPAQRCHSERPKGWRGWLASTGPKESALALLEGYRLGLESLEGALREHQVEQLASLGRPFDPHTMNAMAVEETTRAPAGTVLE